MKKNSFSASTLVLGLLLLSLAAETSPVVAASSSGSCTSQTDPFSVDGATWGTPGSPMSAYPGDQDVPLTITFLFSGPCTSPQTTFYLGLTQGGNQLPFVGLNGVQEPSLVALNISPNTLVSETFYLNIDQNAQTGLTYYVPLIVRYSNNTVSDIITQTAIVSGGPLAAPVPLYGPVKLSLTAGTTRLAPGAVNNVTITVTNTGTGTSGPVSIVASAPAGVSLFNQLAPTGSLAPGASSSQLLQVFVSSSLGGSAFVLTFTSKYLDPYSNAQTATQTMGFTASGTAESSSFLVDGANWGGGASTASPLPGSQETPLVVSLQYLGSAPVTSLQGTLQLPSGFTDLNGRSSATAYSAAMTQQYGTLTLTFNLDIASTVQAGSYNFSLALSWMTSQSSGLTETVVLAPPPVAQLQSSFVVEGAAWQRSSNASALSASSTAPEPGSQDAPLVVTLQYLGTTSTTRLQGSLALPAGVTNLNGRSTATAYSPAASPGQVVELTFYLDIGSGVKPGSYDFALQLSWLTSVGVEESQAATVMPPPIAAATAASFPLSVAQANSTVTAGSQTSADFTLTNEGSAAIYSPAFSLGLTSPLVLVSVDSTVPTSELGPSENATFVAHVTAGPSSNPGIYSGTLAVAFTDSSGASHSQSFPVSFTLDGTVVLILQDTAVSQTATGFTVTGSILNEGSVAAYYASITGLLGTGSAAPIYLGEIDPNSPLPFSVTIPFTAPATLTSSTTTAAVGNGSGPLLINRSSTSVTRSASRSFNFTRIPGGNFSLGGGFPRSLNGSGAASSGNTVDIALSLSYKDTFGETKLQSFTVPTTVKTASQLSGSGPATLAASPSGDATLRDVAYGVVAVLVAALVGGALMVRRHRARAFARLPPDRGGDESVF